MKIHCSFLQFVKGVATLLVLTLLSAGTGCEKDNADSGGDNGGGGSSPSASGTWVGGGIRIVLTETYSRPGVGGEGEESGGDAVLHNQYGALSGLYVFDTVTDYLSAAGEFSLSGTVRGNKWDARYDDGINVGQVILTKQ